MEDIRTRTQGLPGAHDMTERLAKRMQSQAASGEARVMVEEMALLLQAACLNQVAAAPIAQAFGQARLIDKGCQMGALSRTLPIDQILETVTI